MDKSIFINSPHKYLQQDVFTIYFKDNEPMGVYAASIGQAQQIAVEYFKVKKRDKQFLKVSYGYPTSSKRVRQG